MKQAVRAIIMHDKKLLVMHRDKFGMKYTVLIGGGIDMGESIEQALYREVREETGVVIQNPRLVFIEEAGPPYGTQYVFLCDYVSGEPQLSEDSGEVILNREGHNLYTPAWLPLSDLPKTAFRSDVLKRELLRGIEHGFPSTPKKLVSTAKISYTNDA